MPANLYEILGVDQKASLQEIKMAYRRLAQKYHPDKNAGDKQAEKKFIEIAHAYKTLSDKASREFYDTQLNYGELAEMLADAAEQLKRRRPPPPQFYRRYYQKKTEYTRRAYIFGIIFVFSLILIAFLVPYFLLRTSSTMHYDKALGYYYNHQYLAALENVDMAIRDFGENNAEACALAGVILTYHLKDYKYSLKYIRKGLKFNPSDSLASELKYLEGVCLFHNGQIEAALTSLGEVRDYSRTYDSAWFRRGVILCFTQNKFESAQNVFSQLISKNPDFDKARYYYAYCLQKRLKNQEAIEEYDYLIQRNYELPAVYYHRAKSEIKLDRMEEACADLKYASSYNLQEARQMYNLYCQPDSLQGK